MKRIGATLIGAAIALGAGTALAQPCVPGRAQAGAPQPCMMPPPHHGRARGADARQQANRELGSMQRHARRTPGAAALADPARHMEQAPRPQDETRGGRAPREDAMRQSGDPEAERGGQDQGAMHGEVERLREAVRDGRMSPESARERMRELRSRRSPETGRFSAEERMQLRRDIQDANRNLDRR